MNDLTPTGAALWSATAATCLAYLGIEPAPLFWSLFGAVIGLSVAAPTSRFRAACTFVAVVFASSLFGSYIAQNARFIEDTPMARCVCSCLLASLYHPTYQFILSKLPEVFEVAYDIWRRWMDRVFGAKS